jgi:Fe-S-cluster-containing hydrogenase component 2
MLLDPFEAEMKAEMCRQCRKPFCMLACPKGAIVRDDRTGAYVVMSELCDGCGACAEACPFNRDGMVLRLDKSRGVFIKCDLCGGAPECVAVCPTGALKYMQVGKEEP